MAIKKLYAGEMGPWEYDDTDSLDDPDGDFVGELIHASVTDGKHLAAGLRLSDITANMLVASDTNKNLVSSAVTNWVAGTADEITVSDDGDGSITLSLEKSEYKIGDNLTLNDGTSSDALIDTTSILDGNEYHIVEATGVPGIDLEIGFTGVTSIRQVVVRAYYDGIISHAVRIQLYNYTTVAWDTIDLISNGLDYSHFNPDLPDDTDYISGGAAIVRFYHTETGDVSHDLYLDYVALKSRGV